MPSEYRFTRRVEFADCDMAGIMHFSNFFRFMESAEHAFYRAVGISLHEQVQGKFIGWPRVSASCDFAKPLRFGDEVEVQVLLKEIGEKSMTYTFIFRKPKEEEEIARGMFTVVCACQEIPGGNFEPIPIPKETRARIQNQPS